MLKIRHFNQSIIPFILSKAFLTVFQLARGEENPSFRVAGESRATRTLPVVFRFEWVPEGLADGLSTSCRLHTQNPL